MSTAVADTILEQLGGRQFIVMTGAKNLMSDNTVERGQLSFRLETKAKYDINYVQITLCASDTYLVQFFQVTTRQYKFKKTLKAESRDVHAPQLKMLFEAATGLDISI